MTGELTAPPPSPTRAIRTPASSSARCGNAPRRQCRTKPQGSVMKKLMLIAAAAAAISAASAVTPANALTIIKPGCCGGFNPGGGSYHPHRGGGVSIGIGLDPGYGGGGDCYYGDPKGPVPHTGVIKPRS